VRAEQEEQPAGGNRQLLALLVEADRHVLQPIGAARPDDLRIRLDDDSRVRLDLADEVIRHRLREPVATHDDADGAREA